MFHLLSLLYSVHRNTNKSSLSTDNKQTNNNKRSVIFYFKNRFLLFVMHIVTIKKKHDFNINIMLAKKIQNVKDLMVGVRMQK